MFWHEWCRLRGRWWTRVWLVLSVALLVLSMGFTTSDVTVTATPRYVSITVLPLNWTINSETGDSKIHPGVTYYSNPLGSEAAPGNPVVNGECTFNLTNSSNVAVNITINFSDFVGGSPMSNSNTGAGGVGQFGARSYFSGENFAGAVICKTAGSSVAYGNMSSNSSVMWGLAVAVQTDDFTTGVVSTGLVTVTATV